MKDNTMICYCSNVTKDEILIAISNGATTMDDIRSKTNACTLGLCEEFNPEKRCCSPEIMTILKEACEINP